MFKNMPKGHLVALGVLVAVLIWAIFARDMGDEYEASVDQTDITALQTPGPVAKSELPAKVDKPEITEPKPEPENTELLAAEGKQLESAPVELPGRIITPKLLEPSGDSGNTSEDASPPEGREEPVPPPSVAQVEPTYQSPPVKISEANKKQTHFGPTGMSADELFLMDQPPDTYTLQIVAASSKDALQKYMLEQKNRDDLHLYQALREGRVWFVVVTGIFTSREDAQQAISGLPAQQKKAGPWPRQLSGIQSEIVANRSK